MRTTLIGILALAAAACGSPTRGDLTVLWTFNGGHSCAEVGVASIQVDVAGEVLSPNTFACSSGNGAFLGRYFAGSYTVTLTGLDSGGAVLYQQSQTVQVVAAGTTVTIDVGGARVGSATLHWTFGGSSCAASGVSVVHVSVDGQIIADAANNADLPCAQAGVDGVAISPLAPGPHSFDLTGYVNGRIAYALQGTQITVVAGKDTSANVNLPAAAPTSATADVRWSFAGMSCADARVDTVHVFFDPRPDGTGGVDSGVVACSTLGNDGAIFDGVSAGTHSVAVTGIRGNLIVYQTRAPASASFQIGLTSKLVVSADAASPARGGVALTWQFPAGGPSCTGPSSTAISYQLTDPNGQTSAFQPAPCGAGATALDFCWTGSSTGACPGLMPGYWTINATAGAYVARNQVFAVPNDAHSSAVIAFVHQ
jgi:hypothetical protein